MTKIALLIGVSEYGAGLDPLPSAVNDVTAMQQVLTNPSMGGFAAGDVTVLQNPSRQEIEESIYNLFLGRHRDDLVLLYFSGHGLRDDRGDFYFASRSTRKDQGRLVPPTAVAARPVRDWMQESRSQRKVIIIDSSFSGAFARGVDTKDSAAILTASGGTQYALIQDGFDQSMYTHYLVEGIRTGAADQDNDGFITTEELHAYVSSKVRAASSAMTPEFYPMKEGYKIRLTKSPTDAPKLQYRRQVRLLAEEAEGDFSPINRAYLDDLQLSLGLLPEDAAAIETDFLEPYRLHTSKMDRYRTVFEGVIAKQYPLSGRDRLELERFQQLLGLRGEDVAAIEAQLLSQTVGSTVIASYEQSLHNINREQSPAEWAEVQSNLANAYFNRTEGDRAENLEQAIAAYESALQIYTREAFPVDWAKIQTLLAKAYSERILDDRAENLERAIDACESALQIYTRETFPEEWAKTQTLLAKAYSERILGDRAENLERAIVACEAVLQIYTREALPVEWANTQTVLAKVYSERIQGDHANNLEQAIVAYQLALQVYTRDAFPQQWAATQSNLATTYAKRIRGKRAENLEQAIAAYESILQIYTHETFPVDWARTQILLAEAYSEDDRAENLERAISACQSALQVFAREAFPKDWISIQIVLANAYFKRIRGDRAENLEYAIASYDQALSIQLGVKISFTDFTEVWNNRGMALVELQRYEEAITSYDQAIAIQPDVAEVWSNRGHVLATLRRYEEAIASYDRVLEIQPDLSTAWNSRGVILAELERYEDAIACYERALALQPDLSRAWDNRGEALDKLGRYEEAFASFDQALQYQPDVAEIWNHRGNALKKVNQHDALPSFNRAIELKPYFVAAIANRGDIYRSLSRYEEALQDFNRAIEIEHQEAWLFAHRGQVFLEIERYEEALTDFNRAIELDPTDAHAIARKAQALAAIERYEEARQSYENALAIFREKGDRRNEAICLRNLGNTYQKTNESQQAIECFQKSLELSQEIGDVQNQATALSSLDNVYASIKQYSQAIDYCQQALSRYREIGDRHNENLILVDLADVHQTLINDGQSIDVVYEQAVAADLYEQALAIAQELGNEELEISIQSKLIQALLKLEPYGGLERAIAVAQAIPDQEKRFELLSAVVKEMRRVGGDRIEELLVPLRGDFDARIRQLVNRSTSIGVRNALVVGISTYTQLGNVRNAAEDAESIAQLLERYGNFRVRRLPCSLINGKWKVDPSKTVSTNEVEEAITQLFPQDGDSVAETALLFFAGHGISQNPDGLPEGFFATTETNPSKGFYGFSWQSLHRLLGRSVVRQKILLLDFVSKNDYLDFTEFALISRHDHLSVIAYAEIENRKNTRSPGDYSTLTNALLRYLNPYDRDDGIVTSGDLTTFINSEFSASPHAPLVRHIGRSILLTDYRSEEVLPQITSQITKTFNLFLSLSSQVISVGNELSVTVHLNFSASSDNTDAYLIEIPISESVGNELNILLIAAGFQVEGDSAVSLPLDLDTNIQQTTQTISFRLIALRPGTSTITVELYRGDAFETTLEKTVQVVGLEESAFLDTNIKTEPRPVSQPDLVLQVQTLWNETASVCTFRYHLRSFRASSLLSSGITYQSQPLSNFWLQQVHELLQNAIETVSDALPADGRSHLTSFGHYLFQQLFPTELQADLRNLNRYQANTLLILADQDAQLPWTLLHNGQEFLGERFILGHWLWDLNNTQPYEFPVGAINVAHYANVEQPEVWATLLEPPGAPPPYILTGGVLDDLGSMEAMRGLHLIRLGQSVADAERQDAPVPLDVAVEAPQDIDQKVRPIKLNLRRNRPLVTLSYLRQYQPELTSLQQTWAATFIRAGCSAFVGTLWAVNPATEAAFISSFYHALWTGDSLGGAFQTARRLARATTPDSLDWLAYLLFGDPMARPYRPVQGQGYTVVEPIGQDIDDPVPPGTTIRFRVSLRRTPPVWHEERVIEVAENLTFNDLQAHIVTFGLQVTPAASIPLRLIPSGNYLGWFNLSVPSEIAGDAALVQVYFADGMQTIHTLTFPLTFQQKGGHPV